MDNVRLVCVAVNFGMGQWGEEALTLARAASDREKESGSNPPPISMPGKPQKAYRRRSVVDEPARERATQAAPT
jgi:hypothetical protein